MGYSLRGLSTQAQRAPCLLQRAALEGLISLGPNRGRESTYRALALEADSSTSADSPSSARSLLLLAERYFTSHGPATLGDFCWWSGVPTSQAREAIRSASSLVPVTMGGTAGVGWQ